MTDAARTKGVSIERLQSFLAIVDAGGLARAAPDDPVRQSQLSRQLKELEIALAAQLFDRRARAPTDAGRALARTVRDLHRGLDDVVARAAAAPVVCKLGAGDSALQWILLPEAGALAKAHPRVRLDVEAVSAEEAIDGVVAGTLDLALARAPPPRTGVVARVVGRVDYALFVGHAAARRAPRGADWRRMLDVVPLCVLTGEPALDEALAALGPATLRCATFPQVAAAVRSSDFAGVLPRMARAAFRKDEVRVLDAPPLLRCASSLSVVWRRGFDDVRPELSAVRATVARLARAALRADADRRG